MIFSCNVGGTYSFDPSITKNNQMLAHLLVEVYGGQVSPTPEPPVDFSSLIHHFKVTVVKVYCRHIWIPLKKPRNVLINC